MLHVRLQERTFTAYNIVLGARTCGVGSGRKTESIFWRAPRLRGFHSAVLRSISSPAMLKLLAELGISEGPICSVGQLRV